MVQDIFLVPNSDRDDKSSQIAEHEIDEAFLEIGKNQKEVLAEAP